jgi:hypothetical protein
VTGRSFVLRLALALAAAFVAAVLAAVAIAIADLYLVGHGQKGLLKETVSWPTAGVHLSIGDLLMLALSFAGAALAWKVAGRWEGK